MVTSAAQAQLAAASAAGLGMGGLSNACSGLSVQTNTTDFVPGGTVSVTVTCRVDFSDLLVPGLPGSATLREVQVAPIDPYRSVR